MERRKIKKLEPEETGRARKNQCRKIEKRRTNLSATHKNTWKNILFFSENQKNFKGLNCSSD